jgi:quinol monooxygenase YgiN
MADERINIFYELKIKPGKADELREIAKKMVAYNAEGEPGTLVYNVYISEDEELLTYWETHENSAALLFHSNRFINGSYVGQVLERTEGARLCLYGIIPKALKDWASEHGFENEYHEPADGFQR